MILTPSAYRWLSEDVEGEIEALTELTGHPVRWQYKLPSQPADWRAQQDHRFCGGRGRSVV